MKISLTELRKIIRNEIRSVSTRRNLNENLSTEINFNNHKDFDAHVHIAGTFGSGKTTLQNKIADYCRRQDELLYLDTLEDNLFFNSFVQIDMDEISSSIRTKDFELKRKQRAEKLKQVLNGYKNSNKLIVLIGTPFENSSDLEFGVGNLEIPDLGKIAITRDKKQTVADRARRDWTEGKFEADQYSAKLAQFDTDMDNQISWHEEHGYKIMSPAAAFKLVTELIENFIKEKFNIVYEYTNDIVFQNAIKTIASQNKINLPIYDKSKTDGKRFMITKSEFNKFKKLDTGGLLKKYNF